MLTLKIVAFLKENSSWISSKANDNFLGERAKISHRLMLKYDLSVVYIRGVDLCIQARKEKERLLSLIFITFLSLSLSLSLFLIAVFREVQLIYERLLVIAELSRAQRSTMGGKIWLSIMHSINFGSEKIVRTSVRTSTPSCKPGWNFAFQVTVRFGGKLHCHPDF